MTFFAELEQATATEKEFLTSAPLIRDALQGDISRSQYIAFLKEAYFHVSQTVPLLMACGSRLSNEQSWLRAAIAHYIDDELGHEEWILSDIRHCGGDAERVRRAQPSLATELMVSYAWDTIQRRNPVGFFGMVYVLEGTSIALASRAAVALQQALALPVTAFSYLISHGDIDQGHVEFLQSLVNRLESPADRAQVVHCARRFFHLYGQIFRTLPDRVTAGQCDELRYVA